MSVKEKSARHRARFPRGGIGSYGNYPRDVRYDHDSFLSEMAPVSFCRDAKNDPYGLAGKVFVAGVTQISGVSSSAFAPNF